MMINDQYVFLNIRSWMKERKLFIQILMPPRSKIGGHNYRVILKFCHCLPHWSFNHANNFWWVSARALIFHMSIPCDKTFPREPFFFYTVTLALEIDPFFEHIYIAFNFLTGSTRALIFYISIPDEWIFPRVPLF